MYSTLHQRRAASGCIACAAAEERRTPDAAALRSPMTSATCSAFVRKATSVHMPQPHIIFERCTFGPNQLFVQHRSNVNVETCYLNPASAGQIRARPSCVLSFQPVTMAGLQVRVARPSRSYEWHDRTPYCGGNSQSIFAVTMAGIREGNKLSQALAQSSSFADI